MPSRKSVRFEDLDDGAEDGAYGLKVRNTQLWTRRFLTRVLRLLEQVFVCLFPPSPPPPLPAMSACMRHSSPSHTAPPHHTQGMFNNLYAQATSYGKWARSHSKTVCDCMYRVDRKMSYPSSSSSSLPPSRPPSSI